jgi:predicted ribosomally synthesized peptide with SipW-like signal peptide
MKKLLLSGSVLLAVAAIIAGATTAFFSDTETSTGNTFTAGDIDLQIDNESYALDYNVPGFVNPTGALVLNASTSWTLRDLTVEKFFDFVDLKPGDYGEDTISVHVGSNDAWVCASAEVTEDSDNGYTEPEDEVAGPNNDDNDGTPDGDLDSSLEFAFWHDDGDNVLETDEVADIFVNGTLANMNGAGEVALADSEGGILGAGNPIPGNSTVYIGKAWCFGELTPDPVAQDNATSSGPLVRGTGVSCDGSGVGNIAQTDKVVGNLTFYAEQARHNPNFTCGERNGEEPVATGTLTITKVVEGGQAATTSFSYMIDGGLSTPFDADGSVSQTVSAGAHTVAEVGPLPLGYTPTFGGDCVASGTLDAVVNVSAGGSATCTITNTFIDILD